MAATVENLRTRLGLDASKDTVLEIVIQDATDAILELTGLKTIPERLDYWVYAVSADAYRLLGYGSSIIPQQISSVKDDKQQVNYAASSNASSGSASIADLIQRNHKATLRRVRKAKW